MKRTLMAYLGIIILFMTATSFAGVCGDANGDDAVNLGDAGYIINYIFYDGPEPDCGTEYTGVCGDANNDKTVNLGDAGYIINYIFYDGPGPDCTPYTIPITTTIIPHDSTTVIQDYDINTGTITLDGSSSYAQGILVGDAIIGQDDGEAPNGFLRKVTSKTAQGGSIVIETGPATMMEAFESMDISETHQLLPSDVKSAELHNGTTFQPNRDGQTFDVSLNCVLYDQDGDPGTTDDQIRLDGTYAFTAELFAKIKIHWFTLEKFEAGIETTQNANLDLIATMQWQFTEEVKFDLAEFHLGVILVGGAVWLVPTLTVEAHIHGDLTVTLETSIVYTQELRYGFGWADDQFYTISEGTKDFTYTPPQFTAEFNFEPGASLNASCLLYNVAGPYMAGKAGFHFQSILNADPCDVELSFDLEAILYAVVGIECDILGLDYNYQWQLYTHLIGEWIYPLSSTGTIIINADPDYLNASWSINGPCDYIENGNGDDVLSNVDPGLYSIEWGDIEGWASPTNISDTVHANDSLLLDGIYTEIETGTIIIDVTPDILNSPWSLTGPGGYYSEGNGDTTLLDIETGMYTISWEKVFDWIEPDDSTTELTLDETILFNGYYTDTLTITDIDGNNYRCVAIGAQVWMAENLQVTHYRNGDPIPNVTNVFSWQYLRSGAYCNYDNDEGHVVPYGRLYNWFTIEDERNVAPVGWRVSTTDDWFDMVDYLGGPEIAGGKLKDVSGWDPPNEGATNESGFTGRGNGYRRQGAAFMALNVLGTFWTANAYNYDYAWHYYLQFSDTWATITRSDTKKFGFAIRCVRE